MFIRSRMGYENPLAYSKITETKIPFIYNDKVPIS